MPPMNIDFEKDRKVLSGPYTLYNGSVEIDFLDGADMDATFLVRARIPGGHALVKKSEKGHPINPPLHVHFDQSESFKVLQGKWGVTTGYDQKDRILTPHDDPFTVPAWQPHTPWPVYTDEDSVVLVWAHPTGTSKPLDLPFFEQIFLYSSECYEKSKRPDVLQMILAQHMTNSAAVMFPSVKPLGSLRWWIPWMLESTVASLARFLGYSKMYMPKYTKTE